MRVPCTGRVEVRHILEALLHGADGVFVAGCLEGDCHYVSGNLRARQRVEYARKLLAQAGIGDGRVRMYNLSAGEGPRFAEIVREMLDAMEKLGPNPGKLPAAASRGAETREQVQSGPRHPAAGGDAGRRS